jgi:pyruvate dehydrogenase E2 component (dihydrolipoamide acetyltransferase)
MAGKVSSNPNEFLLPDLGEGLHDAELIEWCVKEGQTVQNLDVLAKMETAKALVEVSADRDGTIEKLHGKPGEKIEVGAVLVTYKGTGASTKPSAATAPEQKPVGKAAPQSEEKREDAGTVVGSLSATPGIDAEPGKVLATPAVRRLARDMGVDLTNVQGSGPAGRVVEADVKAAAGSGAAGVRSSARQPFVLPKPASQDRTQPAPSQQTSRATAGNGAPPMFQGETLRIPMRGVRRTIAERLRQSVNNAVHFYVMDEANVSALDSLRRKLVVAANEKLSLLPFVALAVCRVLSGRYGSEFNRLNSTMDDKASEIVQHKAVHLGIATDTDNGLMVPVIRNASQLGALELGRAITTSAKSARDRSIAAADMMGSTFTISNFGSLAGRFATPIINYPEAAILAVGRMREDVVARNGMFGVGKLLPLSLGVDHRVVDGATAALFLAKVIELLQSPDDLLPES